MPAPDQYNISIYQGDSFSLQMEYVDDNDDPIDLSTYSARGNIRERAGRDSDSLATFTCVISDTNTVTASLTDTQTKALTFDNAAYDIEVYKSGSVITLVSGTVTLVKEVTKAS